MSDLVKRLRGNLADAARARFEAADRIEELEREVDRWRKGSIDTWGAMNAMRNAINEHVAMPSIEGDLLKGPENSVFCATVADAVIGAVLSLRSKLDAEKALADRLANIAINAPLPGRMWEEIGSSIKAYRKARGM